MVFTILAAGSIIETGSETLPGVLNRHLVIKQQNSNLIIIYNKQLISIERMEGEDKMQEESQEQGSYNFQKKKEEFTVEIRKKGREEKFSRKRNLLHIQSVNTPPPVYSDLHCIPLENMTVSRELLMKQIADPRFQNQIRNYRKQTYSIDMLEQLIALLASQDILDRHHGIIGIRKLMSTGQSPPVQNLIQSGVIPTLFQCAKQQQFPQIQLQAIWTLSNVASGTKQQCKIIVDLEAIPIFIKLLQSKRYGIVQQAVWALGNIACNSLHERNEIINLKGIDLLIGVINISQTEHLIEHAAWAISNLCRGKILPKYDDVKSGVYVLAALIAQYRIADRDLLADCCWAIQHHTKMQFHQFQLIIESGFFKRVGHLIRLEDAHISMPVLRIVSRMMMGTEEQVSCLLDDQQVNLMPALIKTLSHPKQQMRAQACWALSNIAAGYSKYAELIIRNQELISILLKMLNESSLQIKSEILNIFANLSIELNKDILLQFYFEHQIIERLVEELQNQDCQYIKNTISNLYALLIFGEHFRKNVELNVVAEQIIKKGKYHILEALRTHIDQQISQDINGLLLGFFPFDQQGQEQQMI